MDKIPKITDRERFILLGAIHDRIDLLEDNIKDASEEILLLQVLEKKIKAA